MSITATVYGEDGTKPALVLVHGLGSAGTIWKSLISALTDSCPSSDRHALGRQLTRWLDNFRDGRT